MKHLLSINDLTQDDVVSMLRTADHMVEINRRPVPKVPALRGKTVASVFFEDSTRTRLSFETAAKRLSADVVTFSASSSSVNKGESIRDTIETLSAMGVDAFIVRHRSSGVPLAITSWTNAAVVNAGDGWHQHPTQALLDAYTITRELHSNDSLGGVRVAIVGDIKHSRVARSTVRVLSMLGADITLVGPSTLLPADLDSQFVQQNWAKVARASHIEDVIDKCDVLYMLRMQKERMDHALIPDIGEYNERFSLTSERARRLSSGALVMHPGPMNRGVEMQVDPSDLSQSRILVQVTNGIAVRMAVLFSLLGSGGESSLSQGSET
jgi:aspartate carbamoyltransferase catalytic subunit